MGTAASYFGLRAPVFCGAVLFMIFWIWARRRQTRMAAILEKAPDAA
jgi:hypothetical protein